MKINRVMGKHWRALALVTAVTTVFAVACQIGVESDPQPTTNLSLSLVGGPDDPVEYVLTVRGGGMEPERFVFDSDEVPELVVEVPARRDITFSIVARDHVYSGSVVRRFGPGDETGVEIPVYPGPVFVDVAGETLYQVRDLGVDISDENSGTARSFDSGALGAAPRAAEYGPDGRLWVLTDQDIRAYESLAGNPTVAEGPIGVSAHAMSVIDGYVYLLESGWDNGGFHRIHRYEIGNENGGLEEPFFEVPIEQMDELTRGKFSSLFESELGEGDGFDEFLPIHDIAVHEDGTVYLLYSTGAVDFAIPLDAGFREQFTAAFNAVFDEERLRTIVGRVLDSQLDEVREELELASELLEGVPFDEIIAILHAIAELDADLRDVQEEPPPDMDLEEYLIEYVGEEFAALVMELADIIERVLEDVFDDLEAILAELEDDETEFDMMEFGALQLEEEEEFGLEEFAQFMAFFFAVIFTEAEEEQREEFIAVLEFLDGIAGRIPEGEELIALMTSDRTVFEQLLGEDFDLDAFILDFVSSSIGTRNFLAAVAVTPGGGVAHGPTILGPTGGLYAPLGSLRFIGNTLYAAQSSAEPEVIDDLTDMWEGVGNAFYWLRYEIENRLLFAETEGEGSLTLADFFDEEMVGRLIDRIDREMRATVGDSEEIGRDIIGRIESVRTSAMHRYTTTLSPSGSGGGIDRFSEIAGMFWGPRQFVTTRDGRLALIDKADETPEGFGGRLVRAVFGSTSGWGTLMDPLLQLFNTGAKF